ncbi:Metalloenzyme, LuxS/M16 peptidase-like protein [Cokeromyces recurvatus]|uniref:Metalloenzyme, LuxS/M16 peptidase-like protein n=1 Tax=Cokeromyces recurvatus TaxID=90255 RepID=UPI002220597B|nr:Metalloenzyme, LuxS/M16 peptidase-like protein [Cokeromyces recurvatus]KAI7898889.1 Metalloenzyme, LuxS/M16 peptidase-like protein [Cokeromyces recurvatus]
MTSRLLSSTIRRIAKNPLSSFIKRSESTVPYSRSQASVNGFPTIIQEYSKASTGLSKVTTLPNGIRVASENTPGHFSAVGVYVDSGSRYETAATRGMSHILDRLAFKSTANRSADQVVAELESLGGNIMCSSSRESIMYQSAIFSQDLSRVLSLFSDVVLRPIIDISEVEEQRQTALYEIDEIWSKPEMILPEILHTVAYKDNTLGNPLLCPPESLKSMTPELIQNYRKTWYRPERMVIAACGAEHEQVVDLAVKYFGDVPKSTQSLDSVMTHKEALRQQQEQAQQRRESGKSFVKSLLNSATMNFNDQENKDTSAFKLATQPAKYTGGTSFMETGPETPFTHVYVAFEGLSIDDPDIYALTTLQILLGGGGSFSAGGPGKGMYSRLFTNVLNQHYWVESCQAFNHCYTDSGLFGIAGSCPPEYINALIEVICRELDTVARGDIDAVSEIELSRAKNQLKSSLLMNLESRMVQLEDLGRQIQVHGKKTGIDEMLSNIDKVTMSELKRVAGRVVRGAVSVTSGGTGKATVVVQGNLQRLRDVNKIIDNYGLGSGN